MNTTTLPGRAWLVLLILAAGTVGFTLWASRSAAPAAGSVAVVVEEGPDGAAEATRPDVEDDLGVPTATTLGRGGTLAAALSRLEIPAGLRPALIEALSEHLDPRKLPRRTGLSAWTDRDGHFRRLTVRDSETEFVRLSIEDGPDGEPHVVGERVRLPTVVDTREAEGVVESSVAQALSSEAHGLQLTPAFADVFQWDVDLLVDPRPGDRVRIVYEVERFGDLPEDLPPFGDTGANAEPPARVGRILAASYSGRVASAHAFWIPEGDGSGSYYDREGRPLRKSFLKSPLNYRRISSGFSRARRNPVTRKVVPHHGIDYAADRGTPVVASADGRVVQAGWAGALGKAVRIRHGSEYVTVYGHLSGFARGIRAGADVRQNQVVGYVGATGRATGPHLHYTMYHRGRAVNPLKIENPPVEDLDPALEPVLRAAVQRWGGLIDLLPEPEIRLADRDESSPDVSARTGV